MITLTVKTLDNRNHEFEVDDEITVRQFKEHITESVNISPDSQRLIYHGKVLKDTSKLSEYGVHNNVIHLVERPPPPPGGVSRQRSPSPSRRYFEPGNTVYLGSVSYPTNNNVRELIQTAPTQRFSSSRLNLAKRMIRNAEIVLNQLEGTTSDANSSNMELQEESTPLYTEEVILSSNAPIESIQETIDNFASERINDTTAQDTNTPSTSDGTNRSSSNNGPTICYGPNLVAVLDQMNRFHTRFRPVYERYCNFMRNDPVIEEGNNEEMERTQTMLNKVSQIIHFLAHAYHAISDLICNVDSPRPRPLLCRPYFVQHTTLVQTGIPLQVEAHIDMDARHQPEARSEASATSTTETTTATVTTTATGTDTTAVTTETENDTATTTSSTQTATTGMETSSSPTVTTQSTPLLPRVQLRNFNVLDPNVVSQGDMSDANVEMFVEMPGVVSIDSNMIPLTNNSGANYGDIVRQFISTLNPIALMSQALDLNANRQSRTQTSGSSTATGSNLTSAAITMAGAIVTTMSTAMRSDANENTSSTTTSSTGQTSQARSNTQTNPTTSTHTRSSSRPHVHLSQQAMRKFDPYLPCRSHHIPCRRQNDQRTRADAATTMSSNRSTNTNVSTTVGVTIGNAVQNDLQNTLHDLFEQMSRDYSVNNSSYNLRNYNNSAAFIRSNRRSRNHDSVQVAEPPEPSGFGSVDYELPSSSGSVTHRNDSSESLIYLPDHQMSISALLTELPGFNYFEGQSLLRDILMLIPFSFTLFDFIDIINGNFSKLHTTSVEISSLLKTRLLKSYQTIEASQPEFEAFFADLSLHLDKLKSLSTTIDVPTSVKVLLHEQLPSLFNALLTSSATNSFSMTNTLFRNVMRAFLIIIVKSQLPKPHWSAMMNALEILINGQVMGVKIKDTKSKWIKNSFFSLIRVILQKYFCLNTDEFNKYIVYFRNENKNTTRAPLAVHESSENGNENLNENEDVDDHNKAASSSKESDSGNVLEEERPIDFDVKKLPVTENPSNHVIPNILPSLNIIEIPDVAEPQAWHSELPSNWGPVINRDKVRQRKQEYSSKFSDAYMSGMPLKRRKLLKTQTETGTEKSEKGNEFIHSFIFYF